MPPTLQEALTLLGGLGGCTSVVWVIVDWARKDERQRNQQKVIDSQNKTIEEIEKRVDTLEKILPASQADIAHLKISMEKRMDKFDEGQHEIIGHMSDMRESLAFLKGKNNIN